MAAQLGRSLVLKVEDSPGGGTFTTVGGLRATSITANNEIVDVTTKDDAAVRKLLATAGIRSLSISAAGAAQDGSPLELVRASSTAGTHLNYQVVIPGSTNGKTYEGAFAITSFETSGEHNGEVTFSISLESDGTISAT